MSGVVLISISTRSKDYRTPKKQIMEKEVTDTPSTSAPPSLVLFILRDLVMTSLSNHHLRVSFRNNLKSKCVNFPTLQTSQHYNIVKDLAQAP